MINTPGCECISSYCTLLSPTSIEFVIFQYWFGWPYYRSLMFSYLFFIWLKEPRRGVIVSVLDSSTVDRGFEPRLGQIKDFEIGICWFSAKHAPLRSKSKVWLARILDNVWSDMSNCGLLFQWTSTIKIPLCVFVYYQADITFLSPWYRWSISYMAINNSHSLTHSP